MAFPFKLPDLGYAYDALEPNIDARTMEIHHAKHHGSYTNNLNSALEKHPYLQGVPAEELVAKLQALPADIQTAVRNNGGGFLNHGLFWEVITPGGSSAPSGELARAIGEAFDSFEGLKEQFSAVAASQFGSGWTWLVLDIFGRLHIISTPNQDSPYMEGFVPILGLDVWEHAYYLNYQNRRLDYIKTFWNIVNFDVVAGKYTAARR